MLEDDSFSRYKIEYNGQTLRTGNSLAIWTRPVQQQRNHAVLINVELPFLLHVYSQSTRTSSVQFGELFL